MPTSIRPTKPVVEELEPRMLLSESGIVTGPYVPGPPVTDLPVPVVVKQEEPVISAALQDARVRVEALRAIDPNADFGELSTFFVRINSAGQVQLDAFVDELAPGVTGALAAAAMDVELTCERLSVVQGWADVTLLDQLLAVPGVSRLTAPGYGMTNIGQVTTDGDWILNADDLRSVLDLTGSGVRVGVISDGVSHWTLARDTGDLPQSITIHSQGSGDEGTAMLEIVHDLAPGADLYFAPGGNVAEMVDAIDWMVAQEVDVIVDDMTHYITGSSASAQAYFTDGPPGTIANAARDAVTAGAVYVTAAGNWQNSFDGLAYENIKCHWQAQFAASAGNYHDFNPAAPVDQLNEFWLLDGEQVDITLQWSDPWSASSNDYDLFLYRSPDDVNWILTASSTLPQTGSQPPWEYIGFQNTLGSELHMAMVIQKYSGQSRELEVFSYSSFATALEYTVGDSLASQQAVETVISVAAVNATDPGWDTVEAYSSHGPSTIYTDLGPAQTKIQRQTLDITGIDGVQTKIGQLGYFWNPFYGTSAAAPHVAGIAALMLEANPALTPSQVRGIINGNAVDIESAGYDQLSGWGRADALAMVSAAVDLPDLVPGAQGDTGKYEDDDVTMLDNHDGASTLDFQVSTTISGATVKLYAGDTVIGTKDGNGGTITITTDGDYTLPDGENAITATQTESGKLESEATEPLTVTVDTQPPAAPAAPDLLTDTGADPNDEITKATDLTFDVTGSPYFRFYRGAEQISGDWETGTQYTAVGEGEGTHQYKVMAVDVAGNDSAFSAVLPVTIDVTPPAAPAAPDLLTDTGADPNDEITKATDLTFDVTGSPYFRFYRGAEQISGDWETGTQYTAVGEGKGTHQYKVMAVDVAGNDSAFSAVLPVTIDVTPPSAGVNTLATTDLRPELTGTADDNYGLDTVVVRVYVGPTTYEEYSYPDVTFASGEWTLADTAIKHDLLRGYKYEIEVVVTDIAGNDRADETSKELTTMIEGDANGDAEVDGADYTGWADHYQDTGVDPWSEGGWAVANWNEDTTVDGADYTAWADHYRHDGSEGPPEGKGGGEGLDLDAKAADGGGEREGLDEPSLDYTVTNLGDGLYGYTFTLYGNDEEYASFFIDLTFEGVNGGEIQQMKVKLPPTLEFDIHTEADAESWDGLGDPPYDKDLDSWFYGPFSSFTALDEDDNYYHVEAGTGGGSEYEDADVAYIVCSGNLSVTGVASRLGVNYDVEVLATPAA